MKVLIAYATKSGASRDCAETLASRFENAVLADLSKSSPSLEGFDAVVLGSGIWIGRAYRPARRFWKENQTRLLEKPLAFYFCNAEPESFEKAVQRNISQELMAHAVCVRSFGGIQPFSKSQTKEWMNRAAMEELAAALGQ